MPTQQQGMMGLLSSPVTQGLLAAGLGAMASRGSTMQALGRGGLLGLSQFGRAAGAQNNRLMEMAQDRMRQDLLGKLDQGQGLSASELSQLSDDPSKWAAIMQSGRPKLEFVDRGGQVDTVNPYTSQLMASFDKTPTVGEQMTNINNPVAVGPDGQPMINPTLYASEQLRADADMGRQMGLAGYQQGLQNASTFRDVPVDGGTQLMTTDQAMAVLGGQPAPQADSQQVPPPDAQEGKLGFSLPKEVQDARAKMETTTMGLDAMESTLNQIVNHPGLEKYIGTLTGPGWALKPGTEQADFKALLEQLQGQTFMQAYQQLKGGGPITDIEGKKAADAMIRASRTQSVEAFRKAMGEAQEHLRRARAAAYEYARLPAPGAEGQQQAGNRPSLGQIFGN